MNEQPTQGSSIALSQNGTITRMLGAVHDDRPGARESLWNAIYLELHEAASALMARESPGHTLQPTALVNECYARIEGGDRVAARNRSYFFASAAQAMRRILIERARRKRLPRGRDANFVEVPESAVPIGQGADELTASLRALAEHDSRVHEVMVLRSLAGRSVEETAAVLGISTRTVKRCWAYGRAWLFEHLDQAD